MRSTPLPCVGDSPYRGSGRSGCRDWLFDPAFTAAWVAVADGTIVGHIAVQAGYGGPEFEEALHRPASETLGITRFFVAPSGRGSGAASAMLDAVDEYADERGAALALDVLEVNETAMRLYERRGWRRIGSHTTNWFGPDGPHPTVFLYVK
jgi:GNAT superfamily N-acetyltransferase